MSLFIEHSVKLPASAGSSAFKFHADFYVTIICRGARERSQDKRLERRRRYLGRSGRLHDFICSGFVHVEEKERGEDRVDKGDERIMSMLESEDGSLQVSPF